MMKRLCHIVCVALAVPGIVLAAGKQEDHAKRLLAEAEFALSPRGTVFAAAWPDTNIVFRASWWPRATLVCVKATLQDVLAGKTDLWNMKAYAHQHNSFTILASGKAVVAEHRAISMIHRSSAITSNQQQRLVSRFAATLPSHSALKAPLPPSSVRLLIETLHPEGRKQTHYYVENGRVIYDLLSSIGVKTWWSQQSSAPYRSQPRDARLQTDGER